MPIFQADLDNHESIEPAAPIEVEVTPPAPTLRRLSEESIRTELCEGPIFESPPQSNTNSPERTDGAENGISDRASLIERLKRAQSPTWIPNRHVRCSISLLQYPNSNSLTV
jgi:hypothetical protein